MIPFVSREMLLETNGAVLRDEVWGRVSHIFLKGSL